MALRWLKRNKFSTMAQRATAIALAAVLLAVLAVTPAHALNLLQAYQAALASDPVFATARAQYAASIERLPQARANLMPWLSATAGASYADTRTRYTNNQPQRHTHGDSYSYRLVLSQPLFDWSSWTNYEAAQLAVTQSELILQQAHQDLLLRVSQAYFDVLAAEDAITALEAERAAIVEQLEAARRNFELGTATITDTYEAEARYDLVQAQLLQAINTLDIRRDALEQIIGQPVGNLSALPPEAAIPPPEPGRVDAWVDRAQSDSLDVVVARLTTAIAEKDIQIARAGYYPQVDLVADFSQSSTPHRPEGAQAAAGFGPGRARGTSSSIGIQVTIPIYSGGLTSSRVSEAVALQQRSRYEYENARRQATHAARESFFSVISGLAQIRALEAGEQSSRKALEANETGYELGVRINLDVLNAQQQLFATQRDLAQARYNTLMAGLRLKAAAGLLSENDLESINRLLRPRTP